MREGRSSKVEGSEKTLKLRIGRKCWRANVEDDFSIGDAVSRPVGLGRDEDRNGCELARKRPTTTNRRPMATR